MEGGWNLSLAKNAIDALIGSGGSASAVPALDHSKKDIHGVLAAEV